MTQNEYPSGHCSPRCHNARRPADKLCKGEAPVVSLENADYYVSLILLR